MVLDDNGNRPMRDQARGTRSPQPKRLRDLVRLLDQLQKMQVRLVKLVQAKIDAMKRADVATLRDLGLEEQALVKQLQEREGLRRQLLDKIGEEMGLKPSEARALSVSQIVLRVPETQRVDLLDIAGKLRTTVSHLAQANRVAGAVSREIINHLKWVFASVKPQDGQPVAYAGDGALVASSDARIFEAVG